MERYYDKTSKKYYRGDKIENEIFPQNAFQNGATPEFKEKAKSHCERFSKLPKDDAPVSECPPVYDAKWRFFWTIGEKNPDPKVDEGMLVFPNIHPEGKK